jgi:hypothetical protein
MSYLYLISDYDEYGSGNMKAYYSIQDLIEDLPEYLTAGSNLSPDSGWVVQRTKDIKLHIRFMAETPARTPFNLTDGWGGQQLHIIERPEV